MSLPLRFLASPTITTRVAAEMLWEGPGVCGWRRAVHELCFLRWDPGKFSAGFRCLAWQIVRFSCRWVKVRYGESCVSRWEDLRPELELEFRLQIRR